MKKNAMLKIAAILMVAVLLTTCAISSTFAKYVMTGEDESTGARVAKFGVSITTEIVTDEDTGADAFQTSYTNDGGEVTVDSDAFVMAPGTSGTLSYKSNLKDEGREVAVKVVSTPVFTSTFDDNYCPIVFTINGETYAQKFYSAMPTDAYTHIYDSTTELFAAINGDLFVEEEIGVDEQINSVLTDVSIGWAWAFEVLDSEGDPIADVDTADTELGNADDLATISFSLTQSITQID